MILHELWLILRPYTILGGLLSAGYAVWFWGWVAGQNSGETSVLGSFHGRWRRGEFRKGDAKEIIDEEALARGYHLDNYGLANRIQFRAKSKSASGDQCEKCGAAIEINRPYCGQCGVRRARARFSLTLV